MSVGTVSAERDSPTQPLYFGVANGRGKVDTGPFLSAIRHDWTSVISSLPRGTRHFHAAKVAWESLFLAEK